MLAQKRYHTENRYKEDFEDWKISENKQRSFLLYNYMWAPSGENVSSGVSDQARHKPACAATVMKFRL